MRSLSLVAWLVLSSCGSSGTEPPEQLLPLTGPPTFTLYVSNQSFAIDVVDIEVTIDGRRALRGDFDVEGQHSFHEFTFSLTPGPHVLGAVSRRGDARLEQDFVIDGQRWAALNYWYYPASHYEPTPRSFSFNVSDRPITFE